MLMEIIVSTPCRAWLTDLPDAAATADLVVGAEIDHVVILLDGDDGPAAINVPVSDGDPPEEGSPVECANYDSFRAEGLTDPENSEPPEDS